MKTAARCPATECGQFTTAHVEASFEEQPARKLEFDACAAHALGCLNLAPALGLVVRLSELPCAFCGRPMADGVRAHRNEPLHAPCERHYDAQGRPS